MSEQAPPAGPELPEENDADLPPEEDGDLIVSFIEGWTQVYSTTSELEAQLLRENLRAEGINAQVFSQKDSILAFDLGELSIVRLLVPNEEYREALQLIRERMDTEGEVAFGCPNCGEVSEPRAAECTACGAPLT